MEMEVMMPRLDELISEKVSSMTLNEPVVEKKEPTVGQLVYAKAKSLGYTTVRCSRISFAIMRYTQHNSRLSWADLIIASGISENALLDNFIDFV